MTSGVVNKIFTDIYKYFITSDKYKLSDVMVDLYTKVYQAFIYLHFVFIRFYFFIL